MHRYINQFKAVYLHIIIGDRIFLLCTHAVTTLIPIVTEIQYFICAQANHIHVNFSNKIWNVPFALFNAQSKHTRFLPYIMCTWIITIKCVWFAHKHYKHTLLRLFFFLLFVWNINWKSTALVCVGFYCTVCDVRQHRAEMRTSRLVCDCKLYAIIIKYFKICKIFAFYICVDSSPPHK